MRCQSSIPATEHNIDAHTHGVYLLAAEQIFFPIDWLIMCEKLVAASLGLCDNRAMIVSNSNTTSCELPVFVSTWSFSHLLPPLTSLVIWNPGSSFGQLLSCHLHDFEVSGENTICWYEGGSVTCAPNHCMAVVKHRDRSSLYRENQAPL
jgi:hypothetical protein